MKTNDWLTGAVAITGAEGHVGRALQVRLADLPNRVRALGRSDDWEPAIKEAEAVIHLAGTLQPKRPNTYQAANIQTTERVLNAIANSEVRRIVFLSYAGANPDSHNEYLRTKGQAEQLIQQSGVPVVVFRSTFVYGNLDDIGPSFSSYQTTPGGAVSVLGDGSQKLAPIHVEDLAGLLAAAALDQLTPTGVFEVGGPETFTVDEFVRLINPGEVRIRHIPSLGAELLARFTPRLTPALVGVLLSDSVADGDPVATVSQFGGSLRTFSGATAVSDEVAS